jgi:ubiquinone biosynthesis protein
VVEKFMRERLSPQVRLKEAGEGLRALGAAVRELPALVRSAQAITLMLDEGGLKLHPETVRGLAARRHRWGLGIALPWLIAAVTVAFALVRGFS